MFVPDDHFNGLQDRFFSRGRVALNFVRIFVSEGVVIQSGQFQTTLGS
jgi:hypothetical protein